MPEDSGISTKGFEYSFTPIHKYINVELGAESIVRRKKPGYRHGAAHKVYDNLLQKNFISDRINPKWCTDFTYLFLKNGGIRYNCTVLNLFERSVVVSITDRNITSDLALRTLQNGLGLPAGEGRLYPSQRPAFSVHFSGFH